MAISNWLLEQAAKLPVVGKYAVDALEHRAWVEEATHEYELYEERRRQVQAGASYDQYQDGVAGVDWGEKLAAEQADLGRDEDEETYEPPGDYTSVTPLWQFDAEGRQHRDPREGPAIVTVDHKDWGGSYGKTTTVQSYIVHGVQVARAEITRSRDEESSHDTERWFDADGEPHSFNGNPSVIKRSEHFIPSETYLDESRREFHLHGEYCNMDFRDFEDVVMHKGLPLEALQSFGWDPPADYVPEPAPQYPDRFDEAGRGNASLEQFLAERNSGADYNRAWSEHEARMAELSRAAQTDRTDDRGRSGFDGVEPEDFRQQTQPRSLYGLLAAHVERAILNTAGIDPDTERKIQTQQVGWTAEANDMRLRAAEVSLDPDWNRGAANDQPPAQTQQLAVESPEFAQREAEDATFLGKARLELLHDNPETPRVGMTGVERLAAIRAANHEPDTGR